MQNIQKKIEDLRSKIRHHDHLYYVLDKPEISDAQYDALFKELKKLEEAHPELVSSDSPTQRVSGKPLDSFPKFKHRVPLLSLDSLMDRDEIVAFDHRIRRELEDEEVHYVVEPKFDGLSVEIVYEHGHFAGAGTRGDGMEGEDATQNVRTIRSLPLILEGENIPPSIHLRGEILMPIRGFEKLNKKLIESGEEGFANPRNAASGSIRQLDSSIAASRPLDIYLYDLLYAEGWKPKNQMEMLENLRAWGIRVHPLRKLCSSLEEVFSFYKDVLHQRDILDFEIDGVVIKLNDFAAQERLGFKARSPRYACAFKFEPRREITVIDDIVVQVGRQGTLTPVALLKPVDVGGVTVSRASLHNLDIIKKLDVRKGDMVKVARAGDVIPEVIEVLHARRKGNLPAFKMPLECPVCKRPVKREGAYFFCPGGYECQAQKAWAIVHYASKDAMDIEGCGEETVQLLVRKGFVHHPADLYKLTAMDLLGLEGFKDKKVSNLLSSIEASKQRSLSRFLYALGIRHLGEEMARVLAHHFGSLQKIQEATEEELTQIHGVGPQISKSVAAYFSNRASRKLIQSLLAAAVKPLFEKSPAKGKFSGMSFVFTGELSQLARADAEKKVRDRGGAATGSVSKKTSYVVVGENPGSKHEKAEKLGVTVLTEDEFLKMV